VLEQLPQVRWVGLNAPLARVIVTLEHPQSLTLADLVAMVEHEYIRSHDVDDQFGTTGRVAAP
jgi:hypothetical protein